MERLALWIPNFVARDWDNTVTLYLDNLITDANQIIQSEYEHNESNTFDDTMNWVPQNFSFYIQFPDRVSNSSIRRLMDIDADIGQFV